MALSHKAKRRWSLVILVIGLLGRPPIWVELVVYLVLGILWALPFKNIFIGVGQADPNEPVD